MNPNPRFPGNNNHQNHHQQPQFASIVTQGQQQPGHHHVQGSGNQNNRPQVVMSHQNPQLQAMQTQIAHYAALHQQQQMAGQVPNPPVAAFVPSAQQPQGRQPQIPGQSNPGNHTHLHGNRHSNQGMMPPNSTAGQQSGNPVMPAAQQVYFLQQQSPFTVGQHHLSHQQQFGHHAGNAAPTISVPGAAVHSIQTYGHGNPYLPPQFQPQGQPRHNAPYQLYQHPAQFAYWPGGQPHMMQQQMPSNPPPQQQGQPQGPPRAHPVPSPSPTIQASNPPVIPAHVDGSKGSTTGTPAPAVTQAPLPPLVKREKKVALIQDPETMKEIDINKLVEEPATEKSSTPSSSRKPAPTGVTLPTINASKPTEVPSSVESTTPAVSAVVTSESKSMPSVAVTFMKQVSQCASSDDSPSVASVVKTDIKQEKVASKPTIDVKDGKSHQQETSFKHVDNRAGVSSTNDDKKASTPSIDKDLKTATAVTTESGKESSSKIIVPEVVKKVEPLASKPTAPVVVPSKQPTPSTTAQVPDAKQQSTPVVPKDTASPLVNNNNNKAPVKDASKFNGDITAPISSSEVKITTSTTQSNQTTKPPAETVVKTSESKAATVTPSLENIKDKDRFVYDRAELYRLKESILSQPKPAELTDEVMAKIRNGSLMSQSSKSMSGGAIDSFLPSYAASRGPPGMQGVSGASRSIRQSGSQIYSGRPSQDNRNQPRKIIPSPSLSQDVKLHTTENAWKPEVGVKKPTSEEDSEELVTKELLKRFRGYLNKITPQKYDVIEGRIRELKIDTEDRLKRVLDLIFDKAVDEPAFCIQYANLCRYLGTVKVQDKDENGQEKIVEFWRLLLTRCQQEFEKNVYEGIDLEGREAAITATEDIEKKKILQAELEEDKRRARRKSLGNMKLVGELYRLQMLKGFIMLNCVHKLCSDIEDETLECLCILLKTIGQQLETEMLEKKSSDLEYYFTRLRKIVADKSSNNVSSRVRFLLQDIIDMRENGWQERAIHKDNKPKTIDQIHEEVAVQEKQNLDDHYRHQSQMKNDRRKPDQYNTRKSQQGIMQSRGNQQETVNSIISVLKTQQAESSTAGDAGTTTLGPKSFGLWGAGAKSNTPSLPAVVSRPSQEGQINRNASSSLGPKDSGRGPSSYSGGMSRSQGPSSYSRPFELANSRHIQSQPPKSNTPPFGSARQDLNRSRNASLEKGGKGSAPSSRSSSQRMESPRSQGSGGGRSPATPMPPNLSEEQAKNQVQLILRRFGDDNDLKILEKEVEKHFNEQTIGMFFTNAINEALEGSHSDRQAIGPVFAYLICKSELGLTVDIFLKALDDIVEISEELRVDVPKIWAYLAELNASIFLELKGTQRKSLITSALKGRMNTKDADEFVASLLKTASSIQTPGEAMDAWNSTGLSWSEVLSIDLETFSKGNGLDFVLNSCRSSPVNTSEFKTNLQKSVEKLILDRKPCEDITTFVQSKIGSDEKPSADIISALTSAILNSCIQIEDQENTLDEERLGSLCPILSDILQEDEESEHHCLHAIQLVLEDHQHPQAMSGKILQVLYDKEVLGHDIILEWADDKDPKSSKGKAVAVLNANRFLDWLRETEGEDDDQTANEDDQTKNENTNNKN